MFYRKSVIHILYERIEEGEVGASVSVSQALKMPVFRVPPRIKDGKSENGLYIALAVQQIKYNLYLNICIDNLKIVICRQSLNVFECHCKLLVNYYMNRKIINYNTTFINYY